MKLTIYKCDAISWLLLRYVGCKGATPNIVSLGQSSTSTALNKEGQVVAHLRSIFPKLSIAKIHDGEFEGPHIRKKCCKYI